MKKTQLILVAAVTVLASSVAFAAPPDFKGADTNGDGFVDAEEFTVTKITMKFEKLDKDGDGKLSKEEYSAALDEDCA